MFYYPIRRLHIKHIDLITKKAFIRVNILRKFKFILDRKTLEKIILPSFGRFWNMQTSYGITKQVTGNNCTKVRRNKTVYHFIKIYFLWFSRLACNVSQPVSLYKLLIDNNRVPPVTILAASIWKFSNLFIKNNVAIVPCNFENIHDYNTRQAVSIPPVRTRTTLYNNYFLPSTVRLWNIESTSIRDSKSPSSLKSYYKSKCIKKKYIFLWFSRLACNVSQPVCLYKLLIDTNRVPPVTILAASIWTFSNLFIVTLKVFMTTTLDRP
jgi:hypothetical protein